MVRRWAVAFCVAVALVVPGVRAHSAPDPPGTTRLIIHINAATTVTLTLQSDAGKCSLVNSGTNYAALDLGEANKTAATTCATYTAAGSSYSLKTNFSALATCSGTCTNWKLLASLASPAQSNITWTYSGTALTTTPTRVANNISYGTPKSQALILTVKTTGGTPPTQVMQAITLTATDTSDATATASATINVEAINEPGISLFLTSDPSGVTLTGGAFAAGLDFGTVSAYGTLNAGVTRPSVGASSYTARTLFDVDVGNGGVTSSNYTMQAALGSAAATGISYSLDGITLTTTAQTVNSAGTYDSNVAYTLDLVISSADSGSGGPAVGSAITNTISLTATAN